MHFDSSKNVTYNKVMQGKYKNIRMHTTAHNPQADSVLEDGKYDFYTMPPPPPYENVGGYPEGGWVLADVGTYANATCRDGPYQEHMPDCTPTIQPDTTWIDNTIDQFSGEGTLEMSLCTCRSGCTWTATAACWLQMEPATAFAR